MAPLSDEDLLSKILASRDSSHVVETTLTTDERVLARVTDGIYRQPGSALRELVSNAFDADATQVVIRTDRPRFKTISIADDGRGMSAAVLAHLLHHIGGSAKRAAEGIKLGITNKEDPHLSPGGRHLIGKIGIGLFSVSQLTRSFQIITKVKGDDFRTVATVALRQYSDLVDKKDDRYEAGKVNIWREPASDTGSHGTRIVLTDIRPQTRQTLQSHEIWQRVDSAMADSDTNELRATAPRFNIGRVVAGDEDQLADDLPTGATLPWSTGVDPKTAFANLVDAVWAQTDERNNPKLSELLDYYLQMVWQLSLSVPLVYVGEHPFDRIWRDSAYVFELPSDPKESATELTLGDRSVRTALSLGSEVEGDPGFGVVVDDLALSRPLRFSDLPTSQHIVTKPMLFVGAGGSRFEQVPPELSGGPLRFQAYLLWTPKVAPKEHQGALIRIHGASGTLFDATYMRYGVSEQTRLTQITCELFVTEGLEGALNIDRESFNFAHPHVVYLTRWLHAALRRLASAQKKVAAELRASAREHTASEAVQALEAIVHRAWEAEVGDPDMPPPEVTFAVSSEPRPVVSSELRPGYRYRRESVVGVQGPVRGKQQQTVARIRENELKAITQVLAAFGLLDDLDSETQERLLNAIFKILTAAG